MTKKPIADMTLDELKADFESRGDIIVSNKPKQKLTINNTIKSEHTVPTPDLPTSEKITHELSAESVERSLALEGRHFKGAFRDQSEMYSYYFNNVSWYKKIFNKTYWKFLWLKVRFK